MTIVLPLRTKRVRRRRDAPAPRDASSPTTDRVPRVARMLALAHHWRGLIRAGVAKDQASLAALVGVTRARITQVMGLLYLAPDIQEAVLDFERATGQDERSLRGVAHWPSWATQRAAWAALGP